MILEKRLVLLVLVFCFLCDHNASQEATIGVSHWNSGYNSGSTEKIRSHYKHSLTPEKSPTSFTSDDPGSTENLATFVSDGPGSTKSHASFASDDPGSTESPTSIADYESTNDFTEREPTTNSDSDESSSSSDFMQTTQSELITPPDTSTTDSTISTTIEQTICDPSTWPVNASADTREVVNLKINSTSTEWIALSWEFPCDNIITNVSIAYSIERCDGDNCISTNETDTLHNATGLEPCTQYTFNVTILVTIHENMEFWESSGSLQEATTENAISEIGNVLELSVSNVSVNAVQLAWRAPAVHAKCISNYSITQYDGKSCNETMVSATNYTANDLKPCTEYHFTVKTVTPAVQSAGVNVSQMTASPKLSAPQSLEVKPGDFSLIVIWEPPKTDADCVKHYRVSIDPDKFTRNVNETTTTIEYLNACATYQVQVDAVNKDDVNGETATENGTVSKFISTPPAPYFPGIIPHTNEVSIMWNIKKENNSCPLVSIITICNHTEVKGQGYEPKDGIDCTDIDEKSAVKPTFLMNTTVGNLSPFTSYTCSARIFNDAGESDSSDRVNFTTLEDVPSPPKFHEIITDSQFSLSWSSPACLPGTLKEFEIAINWTALYLIPDWCDREEPRSDSIICNTSSFIYEYHQAKAYTDYTVKMRARTEAGWGEYGEPVTFTTKSGVSEEISKFNSSSVIIKENSSDPNALDTILTWGLPCSLNGELDFFNVSVYGVRDKHSPHFFYREHKCAEHTDSDDMCSINLNELKAEYNYTFTISTKVAHADSLGPSTSESRQYPAGIPPQPEDEYIELITIDPNVARKTTTTAGILLPLFFDVNGIIKYYAIMVSEKDHNDEPSRRRYDLLSEDWPNVSSWEEAMEKDFKITYQATEPKWDPYKGNHIINYGNIRAIHYTIGEDVNCKDLSSNTKKRLYCNGPLKPDMWYHVRMRAFTDGGYSDSAVFLVKTNAELNVALVIGAVFGILLMGILVTMMLLVRKCSPYIVLRRLLHSDMPGSPVPAPFSRKKFVNHCQQLIDNPGKLSNEFRLLQTLSVDLQMPTNTACLQANRKKNRYSDILPYDFSRVKLEVIDNDPNTDYINASFIRGYTGEDEYIACQGPKEETTYDFWRMVDQYNINIIVMLTQLVEKGKEKCHQYYPAIRETFRYENMTIRCTSELDYRTHTQRTLVLQKENKKRSITHLHFKDWPDHDVPEDFDAMIHFCQIMRRNINAKDFIVVHCSAGIGRTGTLIAIDILLQHLRDNRKLDVFGTVYRLRHHRINMVQRESQYAYIYNCIKQVLKNPYFLKTYKPPPVDPVYENISKKAKDTMNSDNNLVNNLEILKEYNSSISMESLESFYNLFSWSTARSTTNSGLRHYKSMGAINVKTNDIPLGKSRTLDRVFYKSLRDSSYKINRDSLQDSFPLLTCSRSADVVGDSMQYATDKTCERDD